MQKTRNILLCLLLSSGLLMTQCDTPNTNAKTTPNTENANTTKEMTGPIEMVYVSGGSFMMGCTSEQSDCGSSETPAQRVTLSNYYIGKYEVTQAQWQAVMEHNPSDNKGCDNCPVEQVSWGDVQDFIRELNKETGKSYRLPTEAEWEYAARGGNKSAGNKYSGSNSFAKVGWYEENSGDETHPVGEKLANELGIYDMSGNVFEWCSDWLGDYSSSSKKNPQGPNSGLERIVRGGGWGGNAQNGRVSSRHAVSPDKRFDTFGFRLVLVP